MDRWGLGWVEENGVERDRREFGLKRDRKR